MISRVQSKGQDFEAISNMAFVAAVQSRVLQEKRPKDESHEGSTDLEQAVLCR